MELIPSAQGAAGAPGKVKKKKKEAASCKRQATSLTQLKGRIKKC